MKIIVLMVVAALLGASPALAAPLRGVALVIGESGYAQLPALDNPKRDARAMDDLFDELGFTVDRVLDADGDKLRGAIEDFVAEAADADVALVYYSGHGIEAGGENFLAPTDADLSTPQRAGETMVPLSALLDQLAKTVPVTIVLLDACRTNAFAEGTAIALPGSGEVLPVAATGLGEVRGPTPVARTDVAADNLGMVIGFAASPGRPALDGAPGQNSPYAAALIKHFAAGGYSLGDLMTLVTEEVYLKTRAQQLPWTNSSLRRVLSFGTPVASDGGDEAAIREGRRQLLLTIATQPEATRKYVETIASSEGVPLDALYGMLKVLGVDTSSGEQDLEKQLMAGARQLKALKAQAPGAAKSDAELLRLGGLADKAEAEGAIDLALRFRGEASARADQLATSVDTSETNLKGDRLQIGATYADNARTAALNFKFEAAAELWHKAYTQVERWDDQLALTYMRREAGALANHGSTRGDNGALQRAIDLYQSAAKQASPGSDEWGPIRIGLGNAFQALGARQGDRDMLTAAADAYVDALSAYSRDSAPRDWAGIQSNIGVVMMNFGELDDEGTLALEQATIAFSAALEVTDREQLPIDWAHAQSNLGNVLLMLGDRYDDVSYYQAAADAHRAALESLTRDRLALDWATAQNNLGNALARLGEQENGTETLEQAAAAFQLALEERRRDLVPLDWAASTANLANALAGIGIREDGTKRLEEAVRLLQLALEERTRERSPLEWAATQRNLGITAKKIGEKTGDPAWYRRAIAAYRLTLEEFTFEVAPLDWAQTEGAIGIASLALADLSGDRADLVAARDAYAAALEVYGQVSEEYAAYFAGKLDDIDRRLAD